MKGIGLLCFDGETKVQVAPQVVTNTTRNKSSKGGKGRKVGALPTVATKAIKHVRVGDVVAAKDIKSGKLVYRRVKEVFKRTSDHLLIVTLADKQSGRVVETLKTTHQHPLFVEGKGFVPAGGLAVGNSIVTRAGPCLVVKSVTWVRRAEGYTVYNFEVESNDVSTRGNPAEDTHNYFVGQKHSGVLVHNGGNCITALRNFQTRRIVVGGNTFQLDRAGMTHILQRHHPDFWDGSEKATQSFLNKKLSIDDVVDAVINVMNQNRKELAERGTNRMYQLPDTEVNGVVYKLGINRGRVGQFYNLEP